MEAAKTFYTKLFKCDPNRVAEDQLDWIINEPPIHFSIYSNNNYPFGVEHIGFDMPNDTLRNFKSRLDISDIKTFDPDGLKIELYTSEFN